MQYLPPSMCMLGLKRYKCTASLPFTARPFQFPSLAALAMHPIFSSIMVLSPHQQHRHNAVKAFEDQLAGKKVGDIVGGSLWLSTREGTRCNFENDYTYSDCKRKIEEVVTRCRKTEVRSGSQTQDRPEGHNHSEESGISEISGLRVCAISTVSVSLGDHYEFLDQLWQILSGRVSKADRILQTSCK
jgi:hypothetical protein